MPPCSLSCALGFPCGALGTLLVACCVAPGRGSEYGNKSVLLAAACGSQCTCPTAYRSLSIVGHISAVSIQEGVRRSAQLNVLLIICKMRGMQSREVLSLWPGGGRSCPCPYRLCCGYRPASAPALIPGQHGADARCDPPGICQVLPPPLPAGHPDRLHEDRTGRLLGECGPRRGGEGLAF